MRNETRTAAEEFAHGWDCWCSMSGRRVAVQEWIIDALGANTAARIYSETYSDNRRCGFPHHVANAYALHILEGQAEGALDALDELWVITKGGAA